MAQRCLPCCTLIIVMALGVAWAAVPSAGKLDEGYAFAQYLSDFGKRYEGAEYSRRKALFQQNLADALRHNAKQSSRSSRYSMGVNHMFDWSPEERRAILSAAPSPLRSSSRRLLRQVPQPADALALPTPAAVDWRRRAPSLITPVKAQGRAAAGWSAAVVEQVETYFALASGKLYTLSMQEVLSCAPTALNTSSPGPIGCGSRAADAAYEYCATSGLAQEWEAPYTSYDGSCPGCTNSSRSVAFLDGFSILEANHQASVTRHLATEGPLAVSVDASSWHFYDSGIFDGCPYSLNVSLNHVVQLVGFGYDAAWESEYWIVRNSWSPDFGELGYLRLYKTDDANVACGWSTNSNPSISPIRVCGECGVLFQPSFPIVRGPNSR